MIYANQARAEQAAHAMNQEKGFPPARAVLTAHGWTVLRSYAFR
jgi:hypothetical protein